ncbi:hypothetical protein CS0771_27540 [Catellatospora sp. IY07-71]|uniref:hypothetical protein n=1 Tax=Catellatospora sp. IY07-71 TaxID=2728827 RepID=UPI001BB3D2AA|nr:hypothetical protein [Catellatospora sp. IY07-71]BCJ73210.1 hypothetical protein CS0771_27540 [Catellatospora sp. IY07-71]
MSLKVYTALAARLRVLTDPALRDRGEGPIPHVVMIAMMAAAAITIGGLILAVGEDWVDLIPDAMP